MNNRTTDSCRPRGEWAPAPGIARAPELKSTSAERRPRGGSYGPLPVRFRGRGPGAFPFALARAPLRVQGLAGRKVGSGCGGARPGGCACGMPAGVRVPRVGALRPGGAAVEAGCQRRRQTCRGLRSEEKQLWSSRGRGARPDACVCGLPAGVRAQSEGALRPGGAVGEGGHSVRTDLQDKRATAGPLPHHTAEHAKTPQRLTTLPTQPSTE